MGIPNLINDSYGPIDDAAREEVRKLRHELAVTRAQLGLPEKVPEPPTVRAYVDPRLTPMQAMTKAIYPDGFALSDLDEDAP